MAWKMEGGRGGRELEGGEGGEGKVWGGGVSRIERGK